MNKGDLLIASKWVGLISAVFLLTAAGADRVVVIEDWLTHAVSQKGIPSGWKGEAFGQRADYDFTIDKVGMTNMPHAPTVLKSSTPRFDVNGLTQLFALSSSGEWS